MRLPTWPITALLCLQVFGTLQGCRDARDDTISDLPCEPLSLEGRQTWYAEEFPARSSFRSQTGAGVGDLDGDGLQDLFIAWAGGSFWMRNDGNGSIELVDELQPDGTNLPDGSGAALGDLDGDGDLDVVLATWGNQADLILWNDGAAGFSSELLSDSMGYSRTPTLVDLNGDGELDIFMSRGQDESEIPQILSDPQPGSPSSLYLSSPSGLQDVSSLLPQATQDAYTYHAGALDVEGDGDLDLYLTNDFGPFVIPNQLLLNDGTGLFSLATDCECELAIFGMGVAVGDGNGDGLPDLYLSDIGGPDYLVNAGDGRFYEAGLASGTHLTAQEDQLTSWGTVFVDINQDRWMDLPIVFGRLSEADGESISLLDDNWVDGEHQEDALLMGIGGGQYENCSDSLSFNNQARNRFLVVADLDQDGQPELITGGREEVSINQFSGGCGAGVTLVFDGPADPGIGARVTLVTDTQRSTQWLLPSSAFASSAHEVYMGMGRAQEAQLTISWPDGSSWSAEVSQGDRLYVRPE